MEQVAAGEKEGGKEEEDEETSGKVRVGNPHTLSLLE